MIAIEDFIHPDFRNDETKFYTNLKPSTNVYKFLKEKVNSFSSIIHKLFTHKQLSNDELEAMYSKFLDYIVGNKIVFSSQSYKTRILRESSTKIDTDISDRPLKNIENISILYK